MTTATRDNFFLENWKYLLAALALHAAIVALFTFTMNATRQTVTPGLAIKAVLVDHTAQRLKREKEQADKLAREQAEAEQARQKAEADQQARERAEAEQREREAEAKRQEQTKREEAQRQQAIAEQKRKADEQQAIARKKAEDERVRVAEIKAKQAEKQKAERDARDQMLRENELKRQLSEEEGMMRVQNSGLLNQYAALIEQRVERNWNKPASARAGIECDVKVTQAPGGTVLSVEVDKSKCNGDPAVQSSIEAAVYRSSPLPAPPDARLFQRVIVFHFKPAE